MLKNFLCALGLLAASISAFAADDVDKTVRDALHSLLPMAKIDQVAKSDLPGFHEVIVSGQVVYISDDGKYLMQGKLYEVPLKKDLTSLRIAKIRAQALSGLPDSKKVVFAPAHAKHSITVFTDVDCPFCRQFHKQITEFNKQGITVKYVLYPLDIHPGADKKAVAVWCATDRNAAYTAAMSGIDPGAATCANNPVAETKAFGISLGIDATPTVLAEDGTRVEDGKAASPALLAAELDRLAEAAKTVEKPAEKPVAAR
jgi:thiol:disulfide interchange protein DsbC